MKSEEILEIASHNLMDSVVLVPSISIANMCVATISVVKQNCELDDSLMV